MSQQIPTTELDNFAHQKPVHQDNNCKKGKLGDKILNILLVLVLAVLVITVVVKGFFVTNVVVSGESMLPTYTSGQVVKVDRTATEKDINRGDVVVFYLNTTSWFAKHFDLFPKGDNSTSNYRLLIKRVVATQGEQIWVEQVGEKYKIVVKTTDGQIVGELYAAVGQESGPFIDEQTLYISQSMLQCLQGHTQDNPYTVKQGHFFAVGDNRDNSHDSRFADIGDIPYQNLFGKVM